MLTILVLGFMGLLLLTLSGGRHAFLAAMGTIYLIALAVLVVDMGGVAPVVLARTEPVIRTWLAGLV
jgi:hypothetical protein